MILKRMLMSDELNKVILILKLEHGMDISKFDDGFLTQTIEKRRVETGLTDLCEYFNVLAIDHQEAEALYNKLHNTFSVFFRETVTFAHLEQNILPGIVSSKTNGSEIRIWSAGCSSGQEPYSLAILLSDLNEASKEEIKFRICATDICPEVLAEAIEGVYGERAIENVKKRHLDKYFIKNGRNYEIIPELKKNIEFSQYDLLDTSTANPPGSIFGDFDIVMCNNLFMYYKLESRDFIIKKLLNSVSTDGYFVTGEAEKILVQNTINMKSIAMNIPIFKNLKGR